MPTSRADLAGHFEELVRRAARQVPPDMLRALEKAAAAEGEASARDVLGTILEKARPPLRKGVASDVGLVTFFVRAGAGFSGLAHLEGALRDAVAGATKHEPLVPHARDIVSGSVCHGNVGRGVPVVHLELVPEGAGCHVTVLLKGAATENLSALWVLPPATPLAEVGDRIASHVAQVGARSCPPLVLGVGLGGTPERAMYLSRRALLRRVGEAASDPALAEAEGAWRHALNRTGLGPMGLGGDATALAVHIECADRHEASLAVGVSAACWSDRRAAVAVDATGAVHW